MQFLDISSLKIPLQETFDLIIDKLDNVKHCGSGQYTARCPAHHDKENSLSIKYDNDKILLNCFAGCDFDSIVNALGVEKYQLFSQPLPAKENKPKLRKVKKEEPRNLHYETIATYRYTNEKGETIFIKERQKVINKDTGEIVKPKHFIQKHQLANGKWEYNLQGINKDIPYNLPGIEGAKANNKTVYIVEGEKDADTLIKYNLVGTCSAGGAGSEWKLTEYFKGVKSIVVIMDNDSVGKKYANDIASSLSNVCNNVKVVDLTEIWHDLPEKEDITYCIETYDNALNKVLEYIENIEPTSEIYARFKNIDNYIYQNGYLCEVKGDSIKKLCNVLPYIDKEIYKNNGLTEEKYIVIKGYDNKLKPLPSITINIKDFDSLSWVYNWGIKAIIQPGTTIKDKIRCAMQELSFNYVTYSKTYIHTGFTRINDKWVYLHSGGAIGSENINVEIPQTELQAYNLSLNASREAEEPVVAIGEFISLTDSEASFILMCFMYLAPLREFLSKIGLTPKFVLYIKGETGSKKTTLSLLALSHFGKFNRDNPPASFRDTANAIGIKGFTIKDMPLFIDDFYPASTKNEKKALNSTAQQICRGYGDIVGRGRLNANSELKQTSTPRGLAFITGEQLPDITESGGARFFVVDMQHEDIKDNILLTKVQKNAVNGDYVYLMSKYIEWIINRADNIEKELQELYCDIMNKITEADKIHNATLHSRQPEQVASLMIGYEMMTKFFDEVLGLSKESFESYYLSDKTTTKPFDIFYKYAIKQGKTLVTEKPENIAIEAIKSLINTNRLNILWTDETEANGRIINGYQDNECYYFDKGNIFVEIVKYCNDQDTTFPVNKKELYERLKNKEYTKTNTNDVTYSKKIKGKTYRFLTIYRKYIDEME